MLENGSRILIHGEDIEKFRMVLPKDPESALLEACAELKHYVRKVCGVRLKEGTEADAYQIIIGGGDAQAAAARLPEHAKYGAYAIHTERGRLVFVGTAPKDVYSAVCDFLETYFGVDWYTPDCESFDAERVVGDIRADIVYQFSAEVRLLHAHTAFNDYWRAHQRLNRTLAPNDTADVGAREPRFAFDWGKFAHTFEDLVPFEKYFDTVPHLYSFADGHYGENHRYQLCLSNPLTADIAEQSIRAELQRHPLIDIVSVSQNDSFLAFRNNYCKCKQCTQTFQEEGAQSGAVIRFVNEMAERLHKDYPRLRFHTLAYNYTSDPPARAVSRDNVIVHTCVCGSGLHNLDLQAYADLSKNIDGWRRIAKTQYVWDYTVNYAAYLFPMANLYAIFHNMKKYARIGIDGYLMQGCAVYNPCEFHELRCYLIAKLFQHPDLTTETYRAYMKQFCTNFYGCSGEFIYRYIELLHVQPVEEEKAQPTSAVYGDAFFSAADELWEKARAAAADAPLNMRSRVDAAEVSYLYYRQLASDPSAPDYAHKNRMVFERAIAAGLRMFNEGIAMPTDLDELDFSRPPCSIYGKTRAVSVNTGVWEQCGANSNEAITDFSFRFQTSTQDGRLIITIEIQKKKPFIVKKDSREWEQDCVEIYISETRNRGNAYAQGDYAVRINTLGDYHVTDGNRDRVSSVLVRETNEGYCVELVLAVAEKSVGFEMTAHQFNADGYVNTRYWNGIKNSPICDMPSLWGVLHLKEGLKS